MPRGNAVLIAVAVACAIVSVVCSLLAITWGV